MRKLWVFLVAVFLLVGLLLSTSGAFLVVNNPQHADIIVALAGETDRRPTRALELLRAGYSDRLLLDVPADAKIYDQQTINVAQHYVDSLPDHARIAICPIVGLSTKAEAQDVIRCLAQPTGRILLVTSDYHTRRALIIFRHELKGRSEISVAAASDPTQFGGQWWRHRQWAKVNFDEWAKFMWWQLVDRWRS